MASLANAHKSAGRTYRERSQPLDRRHLGELEKHKDYKKRAREHSKIQETLRKLRIHALNRNPDEFHFHMVNSRIEDGRHYEIPKESENTEEQAKLIESQDETYVQNKLQFQKKKIARLLNEFGRLFADCKSKGKVKKGTVPLDAISLAQFRLLANKMPCSLSRAKLCSAVSELHPARLALFKELVKRLAIEHELTIVANKMRVQRLVDESRKRGEVVKRVKKGKPWRAPVYKWQYERKR